VTALRARARSGVLEDALAIWWNTGFRSSNCMLRYTLHAWSVSASMAVVNFRPPATVVKTTPLSYRYPLAGRERENILTP